MLFLLLGKVVTLQKNIEKTILLYTCITVTVSHRTYLAIDQCIKRKFVSNAAKMWKRRMFGTDFVICLCFVFESSDFFLVWILWETDYMSSC